MDLIIQVVKEKGAVEVMKFTIPLFDANKSMGKKVTQALEAAVDYIARHSGHVVVIQTV